MSFMIVIIKELDTPILVGNVTLDADLSDYYKRIKSGSTRPEVDRRRPSNIIGRAGQLLVSDLLTKHGWKIMPYELGLGTSPLHIGNPVEFLENTLGRTLKKELKEFFLSPCIGIPGMTLRADILAAKKDVFVICEIKASRKETRVFNLTLPQYIYYNKACELGIPVKLILVNFSDNVYVHISGYVGRLIDNGLFKITLYTGGSKPLILRLVSKKVGATLTEVAEEIPNMPLEWMELHLTELESAGLVYKEKDRWYATSEGLMLIKSKMISDTATRSA
jgi:hypothetical protein